MNVKVLCPFLITGVDKVQYVKTTFGTWSWSVWGSPTGRWKKFILTRKVDAFPLNFDQTFKFGWSGERFVIPPYGLREKDYLDQLNPREMWECVYQAMASFNIKGHEEMEQKFYDAVAMYRGMKLCYLEED